MNCKNCGQQLNSDKKFCGNCGRKIVEESIGNEQKKSVNPTIDDLIKRNPKGYSNLIDALSCKKENSENENDDVNRQSLKNEQNARALISIVLLIFIIFCLFIIWSPQYEIKSLQAKWVQSNRIEVEMTVKNCGDSDIDNIYFKTIFFDNNGLIKDTDSTDWTGFIKAGYSKGPILTNVYIKENVDVFKAKWRFDLYVKNKYFGTLTKIKSGEVENPYLIK